MKQLLSALFLVTILSSFVAPKLTTSKNQPVVIKSYLNQKAPAIFDGSYVEQYSDGCGQILTVSVTCSGTCSTETMNIYADAYAAAWPRLANGCFNPAGPQTPNL